MTENKRTPARLPWSVPVIWFLFGFLVWVFSFLSLYLPKLWHGEECHLGKGSCSLGLECHCVDKNERLHSPFSIKLEFCLPGFEVACRWKSFQRAVLNQWHSAAYSQCWLTKSYFRNWILSFLFLNSGWSGAAQLSKSTGACKPNSKLMESPSVSSWRDSASRNVCWR